MLVRLQPANQWKRWDAKPEAAAPGSCLRGVALALLQTAGQHGPYGHSIAILGVRMLLGLLQAAGQS